MSGLQHALDCQRPDVRVTTGVTKDLHHCASCGAEVWSPKGALKTGEMVA